MIERERGGLTPTERTKRLFNKDVRDLAHLLEGATIALYGTDREVRIEAAQPFPKNKVGDRYKKQEGNSVLTLNPGDLWTPPVRQIRQSLVIAKDRGQEGACVRLVRASAYDPKTGEYVLMPREGDIADFFGLEGDDAFALKYMNQSDVLYLRRPLKRVDSARANAYIKRLLSE